MGLLDENKLAEALRNFSGLLSSVPSNANMLARGLLEYADNNRQQARNAFNAQGLTLAGKPVTAADIDTAMQGASFAPLGITAWHGSPHKFSKFDMTKIGTGEGAQAYGHGLYMAESPEVAKSYKFAGDATKELTYNKKPITDEMKKSAAYLLHLNNYNKEAAKSVYQGKTGEKLAKIIDKMDASKIGGGQLYKVDIPDEAVARFLDWDKPLSQQIDILKAIESLGDDARLAISSARHGMFDPTKEIRGSDFVQAFNAWSGSPSAAAEALKSKNINGIRYLDGGSRGAGQGTRNYVLFSDQLPRILEVNGHATGAQPWKPGEWNGLLSP